MEEKKEESGQKREPKEQVQSVRSETKNCCFGYFCKPKFIFLCLALLFLLSISAFFIQSFKSSSKTTPENISTFDECVKSYDSRITETYPKSCKTIDKIIFIETIKEPIDTSSWIEFDPDLGFSFKCPPSWNCSKFGKDAVTIYQKHYLNISSFQMNIVTPKNFKESFVRHLDYKNPVSWFKDVEVKKESSIKVSKNVIKPVEGTDALDYPFYNNYDFSQMERINVGGIESLMFVSKENYPGVNILIPLNENDLLFINLAPAYLNKDPIIKTIINSIKPLTASNNQTIDTSNWKIYMDPENTFSIKYPNNWVIQDSGIINTSSPLSKNELKLFKKRTISINFYPSPKGIVSINDWLNQTIQKYKLESDSPYAEYKSKTMTKIGDYNALKVEAEGYGRLNYTDYFIIDDLKNYGIQISLSYPFNEINEQKPTVDQILSTFRLTQ